MVLIRNIFYHLFGKRRNDLPFLIFSSFFLTFALSRLTVYLVLTGVLPEWLYLDVGGVHVHHFSYGFLIMAVCAYLFLIFPDFTKRFGIGLSILYGMGLGFTFDEFGMWIHLQDDYWIRQSYDAVVVVSAIFLNLIYFKPFWKTVGRAIYRQWYMWFRTKRTEIDVRGREAVVQLKERVHKGNRRYARNKQER